MSSIEMIDSGILELYVAGMTNAAETSEVELAAASNPAIWQEINDICSSLEKFALQNAVVPNPVLKPFLLATIDYTERLKNGEHPANPPLLHERSTAQDYAIWLNRSDMQPPVTKDLFAKIIGFTPAATTAIVWLKDYAPHEVHDNEYEKFLIVEGSCNIIVENEVNSLKAGDYFAIPLHKAHMINVTSATFCKVILQRVAA